MSISKTFLFLFIGQALFKPLSFNEDSTITQTQNHALARYEQALLSDDAERIKATEKELIAEQQKNNNRLLSLIKMYQTLNQDPKIALEIAETYDNLNQPKLAECYYREALSSIYPEIQTKAQNALNARKRSEVIEKAEIAQTEKERDPSLDEFYKLKQVYTDSFTKAKTELSRILCENPSGHAAASLEMAYILLNECKYSEAIPYLIRAYEFKDHNPEIALQIGYTYHSLGEFAKAELYFKEALESSDPDIQKKAQEALKGVNYSAENTSPDNNPLSCEILSKNPEANLEMAYGLLNQNQYKEALPFLIRAYEFMNHNSKVALQIGYTYDSLGEHAKAELYFKEALESSDLEIQKQAQEAIEARAFQTEKAKEEESDKKKAQIDSPTENKEDNTGLLSKYYELRQANNLKEAQVELERVLKERPDSVEANLEMGYLLIGFKKDADSIPFFLKAYKNSPMPTTALQLGYLYQAENDLEKARRYFEQGLKTKDTKEKKEAQAALAEVIKNIQHPPLTKYYELKKDNKLQEARVELERILSIDPNSKDALAEMGYLLSNDHKDSEGLQYFIRAYAIDHDPKIALDIAYIYQKLEQKDTAQEFFRLAQLSDDPEVRKQASASLSQITETLVDGQGCRTCLFRPFYEFYDDTIFFNRFSNWVTYMNSKLGLNLNECNTDQIYLLMNYVADTRSKGASCTNPNMVTTIGQTPIIFDDPIFLIAGGYRHYFFKNPSLFVYCTLGIAYDLIYRLRNISRTDFRGGINYYTDWNEELVIPEISSCSFSHRGNIDADFSYYSRYGYWIGYTTIKEGLNLLRFNCGRSRSCEDLYGELNAYVRFFGAVDTKGEFFNNVIEIGPFLEFIPCKCIPLKFSTYWLQGFYYRRNPGTSPNPYGPRYTDIRFQGSFYTSF